MPKSKLWNSRLHLALVVALVILTVCCRSSSTTVKQVCALIDAELPAGSTSTQVIAFLDSRGIEHSMLPESPERARVMSAAIRHVERDSSGISYGVFLKFSFDKESRLLRYSAELIGND